MWGVSSIHGSWDVFSGILDAVFRVVQLGFRLRAESVWVKVKFGFVMECRVFRVL